MPLDRLVLIIVIVLAAGAATVWLAAIAATAFSLSLGWLALIPVALVILIGWRVIAERLNNAEDDHYDKME